MHERLKLLLWQVAAGLLPTKDSLVKFAVSLNPTCVLCEKMDESIVHLLWNCDLARAIWFGSAWSIHTNCIPVHNPTKIMENLISPPPEFQINGDLCEEFLLTGAIIIDQLWKYRNSKVHEGSTLCAKKILRNVTVLVSEHRGWRLI